MRAYTEPTYFSRKNKIIKYKTEPKLVTLSPDNITLMTLLNVDIEMLSGIGIDSTESEKFVQGSIYALPKTSVEGFELGNLYFKLYGVIKNYKGVELNSIIVKEVGIDENGKLVEGLNITGRRKFSISPSMCKMMGIKYIPGLELWPIDSGFERVSIKKKHHEIDYNNLSTYPTYEMDGTIRRIILELHGFSTYNNSHIITPTGAMIPTKSFTSSLTLFVKQNISTDNGCAGFKINEELPFKIVSRESDKHFFICDEKHIIYVEVNLTKKSHNIVTADNMIGVANTALEGKNINDIIGVKWDESEDENKSKENNDEVIVTDVNVDEIFKSLNDHFSKVGVLFGNFDPLRFSYNNLENVWKR